jgi:hypothetical protein
MTDWIRLQRECKHCRGRGYVQSEIRHPNGRQPHARAARCVYCQPMTVPELNEAAAQEEIKP